MGICTRLTTTSWKSGGMVTAPTTPAHYGMEAPGRMRILAVSLLAGLCPEPTSMAALAAQQESGTNGLAPDNRLPTLAGNILGIPGQGKILLPMRHILDPMVVYIGHPDG